MATCACGAEATANGRECGRCFLARLRSVNTAYSPTRTGGGIDTARTRRHFARLEEYRKVRAEGSQPGGTRRRDIDRAKAASDVDQQPFRADRAAREAETV